MFEDKLFEQMKNDGYLPDQDTLSFANDVLNQAVKILKDSGEQKAAEILVKHFSE